MFECEVLNTQYLEDAVYTLNKLCISEKEHVNINVTETGLHLNLEQIAYSTVASIEIPISSFYKFEYSQTIGATVSLDSLNLYFLNAKAYPNSKLKVQIGKNITLIKIFEDNTFHKHILPVIDYETKILQPFSTFTYASKIEITTFLFASLAQNALQFLKKKDIAKLQISVVNSFGGEPMLKFSVSSNISRNEISVLSFSQDQYNVKINYSEDISLKLNEKIVTALCAASELFENDVVISLKESILVLSSNLR